MATPTTAQAGPVIVYTCCEVWQRDDDPLTACWVCGSTDTAIKVVDLPDFHPWTKVNYLGGKQSATRPYL